MRRPPCAPRGALVVALGALAALGAVPVGALPLPGAPPMAPELARKLEAAWRGKGSSYHPRTRHTNPDGSPKYTNRLILTTSPYLLQHAHNPVSWYAWGDEAFAAAKELHRPVLLSVGYSTCHWCHVMEEESFEDEEIATFINAHYIAIKVDREERPDVDGIYMTAVIGISGSGGWPMTVWLTPAREPFYAGTYFPPHDGERGQGVGFLTLLQRLSQAYQADPAKTAQAAAQVAAQIKTLVSSASAGALPGASVLDAARAAHKSTFDPGNGGTRGAPKFPSNLPVRLLLRLARRAGGDEAARLQGMCSLTLARMAAGGIHDQVGGRFHRYSTDERWLVPHFEMMLYDQAQRVMEYLEGWQATGDGAFADTARDVLDDVARSMTSPDGAFYAATDADSPGDGGRREEGRYFTWTPGEIEQLLGKERARLAIAYWGVTPGGQVDGRSVLSVPLPLPAAAVKLGVPEAELRDAVVSARAALLKARAQRPAPARDDKIVVAWNGLMISAYARASLAFDDAAYARAAARAASDVLAHARTDGRLRRAVEDGRAVHDANLEDYSFLVAGCLDLYEATGEPSWLDDAIALDGAIASHYEDRDHGGFFETADDAEALLARPRPQQDGAEPSGASVEAMNLLRLAELTTDDGYRKRADAALRAAAPMLASSATALPEMLLALDFRLAAPREIVIVVPHARAEAAPFLARLRGSYLPDRVLAVVAAADVAALAKRIPLLEGKVARGGKATAYVCQRGVCKLPTSDPDELASLLAK